MKTLVVDGTNILMRAIFASGAMTKPKAEGEAPGKPLTFEVDGDEVITGGVYIFIRMMSRYVRDESPDRIVVCWDGGGSHFRTLLYPEYKSARKDRYQDLTPTFGMAKEFLSLNGIHHIEVPGVEADDLVASYTRSASRHGEVVILSGDKDMLMLIQEGVRQIRPGAKPELWGEDEVQAKFGCSPAQLPMLMALTGDAQDGIPGIPGFGQKTAVKYLEKYEWSWPKLIEAALSGEDKKLDGQHLDMMRNMALVNLNVEIDEALENGFIPRFEEKPEMVSDIISWLGRYGFASVLNRFQAGTLWKEPVQGKLL